MLACGGWSSIEDCEGLSGERYDRCVDETVLDLYRTDPEAAEVWVEKVEDPLTRDYIYYKVTREVHPGDFLYCERIEMEKLRSRCRVIVSRPHLHRELSGQQKTGPRSMDGAPVGPNGLPPGGPPGGPPPGAPPPDGEPLKAPPPKPE